MLKDYYEKCNSSLNLGGFPPFETKTNLELKYMRLGLYLVGFSSLRAFLRAFFKTTINPVLYTDSGIDLDLLHPPSACIDILAASSVPLRFIRPILPKYLPVSKKGRSPQNQASCKPNASDFNPFLFPLIHFL